MTTALLLLVGVLTLTLAYVNGREAADKRARPWRLRMIRARNLQELFAQHYLYTRFATLEDLLTFCRQRNSEYTTYVYARHVLCRHEWFEAECVEGLFRVRVGTDMVMDSESIRRLLDPRLMQETS